MKKFKKAIITIILLLVGGGGTYVATENINFGGRFASRTPITIIGVAPTSTSITEFNTEFFATTTPTSTDYFTLGAEVDKVDIFISANSTSTGGILAWDLAVNPLGGERATSTLVFYNYHAGVSSGGLITWNSVSTTNQWALPSAGRFESVFPLCNSNYDGTDDIPVCNAGTYQLKMSALETSQVEVYAEITAKSYSD